jgi:hypothetical protein
MRVLDLQPGRAAARLMDVYQNGMLVLHRLRTGGKQTVTVKHVVVHQQVQVNEGGRAVIAGTVKQRRRGRRERKNGELHTPSKRRQVERDAARTGR